MYQFVYWTVDFINGQRLFLRIGSEQVGIVIVDNPAPQVTSFNKIKSFFNSLLFQEVQICFEADHKWQRGSKNLVILKGLKMFSPKIIVYSLPGSRVLYHNLWARLLKRLRLFYHHHRHHHPEFGNPDATDIWTASSFIPKSTRRWRHVLQKEKDNNSSSRWNRILFYVTPSHQVISNSIRRRCRYLC